MPCSRAATPRRARSPATPLNWLDYVIDKIDLAGQSPHLSSSIPLPSEFIPSHYLACTSANRAILGSFTSPYQFDLASQTVTPITALANSGYAVVRSSLDRNFVGVSNGYSYGGEVRRLDATFSNSAALSSLPLPIRDLYLGVNGQLALFGSQLRCSYISSGRFESLAANENKGFTWNGGALVYQLRTDGLIEALSVPSLVSQGVLDLPNLGSVDGMVATPDGRYLIISANAKIYLKELNANGL